MPRSIAEEGSWISDQALLAQLEGAAELRSWFGFIPNFHDAKVRSIAFEGASGALILATFRRTDKTDDRGYFVLDRHADVIFHFEEVRGVVLDCNPLSTILELGLRRVTAERLPILNTAAEVGDIELAFDEVCGGSGAIYAREVSLRVEPRGE
ncbi:MAG: hypothetical protein EBR34_12300 [Sphingomonadaceae bacterium]|nr:hypothetical protein [Sphingomonadaceae bacterium]